MADQEETFEKLSQSDTLALEMYKIIVEIRNLEGKLFWTRQNFYFAVESLLLTAVGYKLLAPSAYPDHPVYLLAGSILGALIALIWIANARAGNLLIWLWNRKLEKLESPGWPKKVKVYSTLGEDIAKLTSEGDWFKGRDHRVNRMAIMLAVLFFVAWVTLCVLLAVIICRCGI
jgi:hypothetical protein